MENIPGTKVISGTEFADQLVEQAMALGADMELENVVKVEADGDVKKVYTEEGSVYEGRALILAVGVKHRMLGLSGEEELVGNGLSFCAVCDGAFYTGQEALLLSDVCSKVTVVQNLPFFTGEKKLADALTARDNVEVYFSTVVTGYQQENGSLTGLQLQNKETGEKFTVSVSGAFLAVGLIPENEAFAQLSQLDERGYFAVTEDCRTATPGVFVAGDCRAKRIRQVTTAAADGAVAALAACDYLS